ncbi:hypothetical protein SMD22_00150 (plasmid) [Brevibacillus halotolerans]|nr:hypothetical protein SMD22_00150 [Brevibacillus halotolerans]
MIEPNYDAMKKVVITLIFMVTLIAILWMIVKALIGRARRSSSFSDFGSGSKNSRRSRYYSSSDNGSTNYHSTFGGTGSDSGGDCSGSSCDGGGD